MSGASKNKKEQRRGLDYVCVCESVTRRTSRAVTHILWLICSVITITAGEREARCSQLEARRTDPNQALFWNAITHTNVKIQAISLTEINSRPVFFPMHQFRIFLWTWIPCKIKGIWTGRSSVSEPIFSLCAAAFGPKCHYGLGREDGCDVPVSQKCKNIAGLCIMINKVGRIFQAGCSRRMNDNRRGEPWAPSESHHFKPTVYFQASDLFGDANKQDTCLFTA